MTAAALRRHCCSHHRSLYVCGGFDGETALRSVERFDPKMGAWEALLPMSQQRFGATAAVITGRLHICGGFANRGVGLSSAERFDPATDAWEVLPPMQSRRQYAATAVFSGEALLRKMP